MERSTTSERTGGGPDPPSQTQPVALLNPSAELYAILAERIRGSATGWSAEALAMLHARLREQYGSSLGSERAVDRLVDLAAGRSEAA